MVFLHDLYQKEHSMKRANIMLEQMIKSATFFLKSVSRCYRNNVQPYKPQRSNLQYNVVFFLNNFTELGAQEFPLLVWNVST